MRPFFALLLVLLLVGFAGGAGGEQPGFSAKRFFNGQTEGEGQLKQLLSWTRTIHVHGLGHIEPDGTLVLEQIVEGVGKDPKRRQWRNREVGSGRYAGTLSDAISPVSGQAEGNRLHLSFTMKGGLATQQWLTMAVDGRTVQNRMVIKKFGLTIASLNETIRKIG